MPEGEEEAASENVKIWRKAENSSAYRRNIINNERKLAQRNVASQWRQC
jgi:hypothetical protein